MALPTMVKALSYHRPTQGPYLPSPLLSLIERIFDKPMTCRMLDNNNIVGDVMSPIAGFAILSQSFRVISISGLIRFQSSKTISVSKLSNGTIHYAWEQLKHPNSLPDRVIEK